MDSIGNLKLHLQLQPFEPKHEYKVYSSCQVNFKEIIAVHLNYMGLLKVFFKLLNKFLFLPAAGV